MTRPTRIELAEDMVRNGVRPGMTLREALRLIEGLIVEATLEAHGAERNHGKQVRAAAALGCTRENVYKIRRRLGLPLRPSEIPVPADWRERLTG